MAATRKVLTVRAVQYKWLVVAVVSLCAVPLLGALASRDGRSLIGLLLVPAAIQVFLAMDFIAVLRWRAEVLAAWSIGSVQLDILAQALRQIPGLPIDTLDGMLTCLPCWAAGEEPAIAIRPALTRVQGMVGKTVAERLLGRVLGCGLAIGVLSAAALWQDPRPILWLLAVPGLAMVLATWHRRRLLRARAFAMQACRDAGLHGRVGNKVLEGLDWQGVTVRLRAVVLAA